MGAFNNSNSFLDSGKNFPNISKFKKISHPALIEDRPTREDQKESLVLTLSYLLFWNSFIQRSEKEASEYLGEGWRHWRIASDNLGHYRISLLPWHLKSMFISIT